MMMMRLASQPFPSGVSHIVSESASANKQGPRDGLCASSLPSHHIICLVWTNQTCIPIDPTALFDKKSLRILENSFKMWANWPCINGRHLTSVCVCVCATKRTTAYSMQNTGAQWADGTDVCSFDQCPFQFWPLLSLSPRLSPKTQP